jgi:hypothetical protein
MVIRTQAVIIAATLVALQGCTVIPGTTPLSDQQDISAIPTADPALDHYIAWIPREKAQTATVAKALTHVTLGNAREQTAEELCEGSRVINGKVSASAGPLRVLAPLWAGGYPAWYYRISQQPGLHGCTETDSRSYYRTLQANLPVWMHIKTANNLLSSSMNPPE